MVLLLAILVSGCASAPAPGPSGWSGYTQTGGASFYANKYQSRRTASGERFDQRAATAAHRSLPFGSTVRVTNLDNGRQVVVRINDRGPFIRGRVIDLSRSAFARIADTRLGVVDVRIDVLD